ncbi:MAG TPA: class I SAM-dependent methyltransferase [Gaiellaceae bacterium]|nr:class I SAM-dependent methyltransferase [Gaiellaceae bacterium]
MTLADQDPEPRVGIQALLDEGVHVAPDLASASGTSAIENPRIAGRDRRPAISRLFGSLVRTRVGRRFLFALLDDPATLSWMLHRLSNRGAATARFEPRLEPEGPGARGFEDCFWLFSSNALNHGLTRLEFDEGAYLFRLVRSLGEPRAAEIGRFRGGTTYLLALAGAHVVSVDLDLARQERFSVELASALKRAGLREQVEIVIADSGSYPVAPESFDLVFVDGDHSYEGARADFDHWWPALRPGGHLLFHDAVFAPHDSRLAVAEGVVRLARELETDERVERRPAPGSLAHFVKPTADAGGQDT